MGPRDSGTAVMVEERDARWKRQEHKQGHLAECTVAQCIHMHMHAWCASRCGHVQHGWRSLWQYRRGTVLGSIDDVETKGRQQFFVGPCPLAHSQLTGLGRAARGISGLPD